MEGIPLKFLLSGVVGFFVWLLGGWDKAVSVLLTLIVLDYASGLVSAWVNAKLSSKVGFKGICKKLLIILGIALMVQIDKLLGFDNVLRQIFCIIMATNEGLSVLENMTLAGIPVPMFVKRLLIQVKELTEQQADQIKWGGK